MIITKASRIIKPLYGFFSDKNLTKKASLNALASGLDYFAQLVVGFIITPMMVGGLGNYFYGIWQIMNRLFGYIITTNGSNSPLEWTLAKEQYLDNYDAKRAYLGSALIVWGLFFPITGILGGIITWLVPLWLKAPIQYYWQLRVVAFIFIFLAASTSLSFMPYAILRGQNQGYRRLGASVLIFFFNGGLSWLALVLKTGIVGVSVSVLLQTLITGCFYLLVCRKYIPWLGIRMPSIKLVRKFVGFSGWFLAWDFVQSLTNASDVLILGLLGSVELVSSYTLTKYVPEIIISIIAIMVVGMIPGLGGIIGTGDLQKAAQVRGEMFTFVWLIITVIGTSILLWNRLFLGIWVGENRFAGPLANLFIVIVVAQIVLIRSDGFIIDLSLKIQRKVLYGVISAIISIIIAGVFVKYFSLGIVGISMGLILGRLMLSFTYPIIVSKLLNISFWMQLKSCIRPFFVMIIFFALANMLDTTFRSIRLSGFTGWIYLMSGVALTTLLTTFLSFFLGLSSPQRTKMLVRVRTLISL